MGGLISRAVTYRHDGGRMVGLSPAPAADRLPGVLLIHDAFGLGPQMSDIAQRLADLGYAVFVADVWGDRQLPSTEPGIRPSLGGMVRNRTRRRGRISAAHASLRAQPDFDPDKTVLPSEGFGGSSAVESLRTDAAVAGAIRVHSGLDLLESDWTSVAVTAPGTRVLLCTGADDPIATAHMRTQLRDRLDEAGIDWELDLYSCTKDIFINPKSQYSPLPEVFAYHPRSSARAWVATERFLRELLPNVRFAA